LEFNDEGDFTFLSLIGHYDRTMGVRLFRNLKRILFLQPLSDSQAEPELLKTSMANSIYLAGSNLAFVKGMLKHQQPVSKSLNTELAL